MQIFSNPVRHHDTHNNRKKEININPIYETQVHNNYDLHFFA